MAAALARTVARYATVPRTATVTMLTAPVQMDVQKDGAGLHVV